MGGLPAHERGLELDGFKNSFQPTPFYEFMILIILLLLKHRWKFCRMNRVVLILLG